MDWQLGVTIILGVFALFVVCCMYAIIEGEIKKHREAKKWQDWAKRKGGETNDKY